MELYEQLEVELAKWIGTNPENVVVCSSGTAALHLALESFQLSPNSYIATCDYTMIAVPRAISLAGHTPVFVDCNADSLLMSVGELSRKLTSWSDTVGVIVVHLYGRKFDVSKLFVRCPMKNRLVIEDLAEAHGVSPHPMSDAACYSFYKNKIIHGEEGGAIYFKDPYRAKLARCLRSLGFTESHDFFHVPRGHNYRMSNVHAGLILNSLECFKLNLVARRWAETEYDAICPKEWKMPARDVPWVYDIRIPGLRGKQHQVVEALNKAGIQARHGFKSMSLQEEYQRFVTPDNVLNSAIASHEVIYLPLDSTTVLESGNAFASKPFEIIEDILKEGT